jgi:glyoxylase-like metal-dependent hydrolase (beta-lactamase superfamily II)
MSKRLTALGCLAIVAVVAWLGTTGYGGKKNASTWIEVAPGILRTSGYPAGYALLDGENALLIDAPQTAAGLDAHGIKKIDGVLLTHYHRGSCAAVGTFLKEGVPVRAPKAAAEWLTPEGVKKYWQESLPLRNSRTAYLVVPEGFGGIDCSLEDGQAITWRGWSIRAVATPGHARAHLAFAVSKDKAKGPIVVCGGLLAAHGKM